MQVTHLNERQIKQLAAIDAQIEPIQAELDTLQSEFQACMKKVLVVKEKIKAIKPSLVPLHEAKAVIVSISQVRNDGGIFEKLSHEAKVDFITKERISLGKGVPAPIE